MSHKSLLITLLLICFRIATPGFASGQEIKFTATAHDFGEVKRGDLVKYDFVFTNTGDASLIISNVEASCGCTTIGEWTKPVAPGKTGHIPIQLNSTHVYGRVDVSITVACNDPRHPLMELKFEGKITNVIYANPPYALFDLSRNPGSNSIKVLTITNSTGQPVSLFPPAINVTNYTAEIKTNKPGWDYQLIVHLLSPPAPAQEQGLITIRTSSQDQPTLAISIITITPAKAIPRP